MQLLSMCLSNVLKFSQKLQPEDDRDFSKQYYLNEVLQGYTLKPVYNVT